MIQYYILYYYNTTAFERASRLGSSRGAVCVSLVSLLRTAAQVLVIIIWNRGGCLFATGGERQ